MHEKPKVILIKDDSKDTVEIVENFPSITYKLIINPALTGSAMDSLEIHNPYVLILGLKLKDGNALDILDKIHLYPQKFSRLFHVFIVSKHLDICIKNQIEHQFSTHKVRIHYFSTNDSNYSISLVLNRLEMIYTGYSSIDVTLNLETCILKALGNFGFDITDKRSKLFLIGILEIVEENLTEINMYDLYDVISISSSSSNGIELSTDAVRKRMQNKLKKTFRENPKCFETYLSAMKKTNPTLKSFISYISDEIKSYRSRTL